MKNYIFNYIINCFLLIFNILFIVSYLKNINYYYIFIILLDNRYL